MLYLASQSPRRHALLARLGVPFSVLDLAVEEQRGADETAQAYVQRVACDKARAGLLYLQNTGQADAQTWVLGADTEVVLDDNVFGKPSDGTDAARMLQQLSGRSHQVLSAVALVGARHSVQGLVVSNVQFEPLSATRIARYVDSGEPFGKAGAYAIQGDAEAFITRLEGSYSAVMGLPLQLTAQLLRQVGVLDE